MKKMKTASFFLFVIFLFTLDNPVSAALPSNELWREDLVKNVVGFGKNTTGGKGGTLCQVTNLNDSGAGSLRACAEAVGPMWITFTVSGTITLSSIIHIKSNKTIDGRGQNIVIANRGITIGTWTNPDLDTGPVSNVIIHNISMRNNYSNGMIIVGENASNVWIDHNTFQNAIDEILYVGSGTSFHRPAPIGVTISWNHFPTTTGGGTGGPSSIWGDKSLLTSNTSNPAEPITITLHHNRYQTYVRHPFSFGGTTHAFNNYYDGTDVTVQIAAGGQFYSENEVFRARSDNPYPMVEPDPFRTTTKEWPPAANVKVVGAYTIGVGIILKEINAGTIFNPASFYSYSLDTANETLRSAIIAGAGRQNVTTPISLQAPTNLAVTAP